ncbi:response regulator [Streptomyces albus subsp. chlorinus]|uniref:response regulator n=1 Tax=Streptomyces albus TaxID=1888 RepID=UPI0015715887|nr:response regulator [Streptomyces albus]NSC21681.1 response regulator [Streptomyces albus subsp. chlorinus]
MSTEPTGRSGAAADDAGILLVDDLEDNLLALEAVLSTLHVPLVRAGSGQEAVAVLEEREVALVLLDVAMPGMDGFETAHRIKQHERTRDIPVIFLTGAQSAADTGFTFRGYATGAVDFLSKPFDPWVLRTKVAVFLDLHRKSRRLRQLVEEERYRLDDFARRLEAVESRLAEDTGPDTARLARDVAALADALDGLRGV